MLRDFKIWSAQSGIVFFGIAFFVQILFLNLLHPLYADDWFYSVIWDYDNTFNSMKINSISDIFKSQYAHYFGWGGRTVAHFLAQLFIMLPPLFFDIVNSFVFIFFILLIYKIANSEKMKSNVYLLVFVMLFMWIAQPVFPSTTVWLTGSCNYLWCTFIVLLFLHPYIKLYWTTAVKKERKWWEVSLFFLFGIVAGWTNENISVSVLVFLLSLFFLLKKSKRSIPSWATFGGLGALIGCVLLLIAPGNRARNSSTMIEVGESQLSFWATLQERLMLLWNAYTHYVLLLTLLFVVILFFKYFIQKDKNKDFYIIPILLVMMAHIAFVAMIAAPIFPPRATFGLNTFMILAIGILYANIDLKYKFLKLANVIVVLLAFSYYIYSYLIIYERLDEMNRIWIAREKKIAESKKIGITDILFDDLYISNKRLDIYDLDRDSTKWQNRSYSKFHGINSVKRKSTDDYKLGIYPQE